MKKIIAGGFLTLAGMIGICSCYLIASCNLVTEWYFNRYIASIFQAGGVGFEFVLALAMAIIGVMLVIWGLSSKSEN